MENFNNSTEALVFGLENILNKGNEIYVRTSNIKEICAYTFKLKHPKQRVILLPERRNNIFAAIAETMWVLAGRNDLTYLSRYLKNAINFSDDGKTWRAGYGPRLRNWYGIDQFREVLRLLNNDKSTRRSVMNIFDPALDFVDSKDIPCNNWLHFLIRDDVLQLNVAVRSNDIIWGFSGINSFEWSFLHEMMSYWIGVEAGEYSTLISSFHLYERHYERAKRIVSKYSGKTLYDFGFSGEKFTTNFSDFDCLMKQFFSLEKLMREDKLKFTDLRNIDDALIRNCAEMLFIYNAKKNGHPIEYIQDLLMQIPSNDFKIAAIEFFSRKVFPETIIELSDNEQAFFDYCINGKTNEPVYDLVRLYELLDVLHYKKSLSYKDSWKKHGEIASIFANISRKFDRLENIVVSNVVTTADESIVDTVADLAVYAAKYLTFLADTYGSDFQSYLNDLGYEENAGNCISTIKGFKCITQMLIYKHNKLGGVSFDSVNVCFNKIQQIYLQLEKILIADDNHQDKNYEKCVLASDLSLEAAKLLIFFSKNNKVKFDSFEDYVKKL